MSLKFWMDECLPAIENELQQTVSQVERPGLEMMHFMLAYHMGWEGDGAGPEARGKRIRPLLVLLCCASGGVDWRVALPAAAAAELVHNFSLVHDDIQDQSPLRRGRQTLWQRWGVAQAINAGDTLFALAFIALQGLETTVSPEAAMLASKILLESCLTLTKGQYLDLSYEGRTDLTIEDYWPMVSGKTAALLSACTEIGALAAHAEPDIRAAYRRFGYLLGLAFQAQDDLLGIWGDANLTGKSAHSDLISGKKSLPVLYGLSQRGAFADRWIEGSIRPEEVPGLAAQLEANGARAYTQDQAIKLTAQALEALKETGLQGEAGEALSSLANRLLNREA
jgi:geranylgeranyl diphosphate synthase type I